MNDAFDTTSYADLNPADIKFLAGFADTQGEFDRMCRRRRYNEPLPYIVGQIYWGGRWFKIDPRAYIPNPESVQLVEGLIAHVGNSKAQIIDVGTGSGVLGITCSLRCPRAQVTLVDASGYTLDLARENAILHHARDKSCISWNVDHMSRDANPTHIIANLQWGSKPEHALESSVLADFSHMPPLALWPQGGPLGAYIELIESVKRRGWNPYLFIETGRMPESLVRGELAGMVSHLEYVQLENYSYCIVQV